MTVQRHSSYLQTEESYSLLYAVPFLWALGLSINCDAVSLLFFQVWQIKVMHMNPNIIVNYSNLQ